jgi:hypothetical protein
MTASSRSTGRFIDDELAASMAAPYSRAPEDGDAGSLGETLASAAAIVLGVLGIIGLLPGVAVSIAAIAAGLALLTGSAALARRVSLLTSRGARPQHEVAGGLGLAAIGGIAGAVLGVLALLGVGRIELASIAALVFGAALLISSAVIAHFEQTQRLHRDVEGVYLASGAEALVGLGAIVLGILALAGVAPLTLTLITLIAIGAAELMSGTSLASHLVFSR